MSDTTDRTGDGRRAPEAPADTPEVAAGRAAAPTPPPLDAPTADMPVRKKRGRLWLALAFLGPALVLLGALVVYPIFFTFLRSLYSRSGEVFVGIDNYTEMLTSPRTLTAIRNNIIWVIVAPTAVTALGLVFAVATERIKLATAFKVAVFMPMAISFLSTGVIWRLVYEQDPSRGLANAAAQGIAGVFSTPGGYPGARPADEERLTAQGGGFTTSGTVAVGETTTIGMLAVAPELIPDDASPAAEPPAAPADGIAGTVWLDFAPGGGGERNQIDAEERGLPGMRVEAVAQDGSVAGSATADADGTFVIEGLESGSYPLRLASSNFEEAYGGFQWLGPTLVTPAIIVSYIWIWAGFAMVVIGAGLAAIPREVIEASRVDGANEWQVFRRVTAPLLAPVIGVVFVTLVINVLKVFDLVLVIAPGSVQDDANVIALEMWRVSFGGAQNHGLGSALAILLFLLVLPAMAFNIRKFRSER